MILAKNSARRMQHELTRVHEQPTKPLLSKRLMKRNVLAIGSAVPRGQERLPSINTQPTEARSDWQQRVAPLKPEVGRRNRRDRMQRRLWPKRPGVVMTVRPWLAVRRRIGTNQAIRPNEVPPFVSKRVSNSVEAEPAGEVHIQDDDVVAR